MPLAGGATAAPSRPGGARRVGLESPVEGPSGTVRIVGGGDSRPTPVPGAEETSGEQPTVPLAGGAGRPRCPECGERFSRGSRFCAFDGARLVDSAEDVASDPLIGQTLGGKYTVIRAIGEGGMGTVYEVRHTALDRKFALKILRPEIAQSSEHIQRFLQEAKAAAAIGHPNIVSVSDFGEHDVSGHSVPFIVMELLRGTSLAALLREEKVLSARRAAKILAGCADALAAAHEAGVIHRDLKPDNVFLSGDGGEEVKVLDFGVAKMQGASKRLTKVGMVFGTPHYMSPEQARGQAIDHRTDIYALGVILYECLCGHVPFEADTSMGVLTKQIFANPEPIERVAPDPTGLGVLAGIVMRCLAKEPDDRFASMAELAASLRMVESDPGAAAAAGAGGHHRRAVMRLREGAAMPRPSAPSPEPSAPSRARLVAFAAGGVAVLALIVLAARSFTSGEGSGASSAPPAPSAPSAPSADVVAVVPPRGEPTAPSTSFVPSPSAPSTESAPAPTASAAAEPSPSVRSTSAGPARTISPDLIDPWSRPKKPPPQPTGTVVDPWAKKK